jgi:HEAT repeat protein
VLDAAAKIPDGSGLSLMVRVASSNDPLAAQAAAAIGRIRNTRAATKLADLASSSEAPIIVRANAARALTLSGTKAQAPMLTKLVADASAPERVRQEAALALGHVGDDASVTELSAALARLSADPNATQLRISIVQALHGIGSETARKALSQHRSNSPEERAFIAEASAARRAP